MRLRPFRPLPSRLGHCCGHPRGFTLVELLVVIGIIAVLMSILLPALSKSRAQATQVACGSNLRQLMLGFQLFADEHDGHIPGGWFDCSNAEDYKRDWIVGDSPNYLNGPQNGTLFPYVGESKNVYRCPALPASTPGGGELSNGHFDYAMYLAFPGAKLVHIRPESRFTASNGDVTIVSTPLISEEGPLHNINTSNMDSGHANVDQMAHHHNGGGNYGSPDGSADWFKEPKGGTSLSWSSDAPSGTSVVLGSQFTWGTWDSK